MEVNGMGLLLEAVKHRKKIKRSAPLEVKRQIVLDELKNMNVTLSRSGQPIDNLNYEELKEEWVIASILWVDIENPNNEWY
jgi:hypothetical protein